MATILLIAGILFVLYGFVVMSVGSGTWFFAFWFALAALMFAAAFIVHAGIWESFPLAVKRASKIACIVLLAGFLLTQACIARDFNDKGEPQLDYIMVLGAQVREGGPSIVLRYRLDTAVEYLQNNPATTCIVTGGQGFNEPKPESHVMAAYLEEQGIDPTRIIVEDQSKNTDENIANSMAFFDAETDSIGIITNDFHVFRSITMARKAGIKHAYGIAAPSSVPFLPNNLTRESLSIAKAFLLGKL